MDIARQVIETSPIPTYIKNEQGRFILVNQAYASIYGASTDKLLAEETYVFDYAYERDLEVLRSGGTVTFEELYKLAGGGKAWYKTTKITFVHHDGKRYLMSQSADITALREAAQSAEVDTQTRTKFLSCISREIRTPISAIQQAAEQMKDFATKEQEEHLNIILAAADNLLTVSQNTSELIRLEAGEIKLLSFPFSIEHTLHDTVKAMAHHMAKQGNTVVFEEQLDQLPAVEGNPFQLGHILMHLINSALIPAKHTEITITAHVKEWLETTVTIEVSVQSTVINPPAVMVSIGIDSSKDENNFQSEPSEDTGTGFALCQHLIEHQGGKLWQENHPVLGRRSHFSIPFPTSRITTLLPEEKFTIPPDQLKGIIKGLNILVVTDTRLSELLLLSQLEVCGIHTDIAIDTEQAHEKMHATAYDLILIDQQMPAPVKSGSYQLRRQHHRNRHTPIIALVPYGQQSGAEVATIYSIKDYLLKPYLISTLYHLIAQHTGRLKEKHEMKASPQAISNNIALYDFSGLGELKDDTVFIRKMQRMFIETVPEQLKELKEAMKQRELAKVARIAHKVKSTFGNIGMKEAAEATQMIERYAHEGNMPEEAFDLLQKTTELTGSVEAIFSEQLEANS
jgi:PAS domain S-box-containing protein